MSRQHRFAWLIVAVALTMFGCKGKDADKKSPDKDTTPAPVTDKQAPPATIKPPATEAKPPAAGPFAAALAHANRPQADKDRDAQRMPDKVLEFFEVKPGQKVAELFSFSGYYAEILGRVVGPEGKVIAQNSPGVVEKFGPMHEQLVKRLEDAELAKSVEVKVADFNDLTLPADLDAVFMILAYHDMYWLGTDRAKMNKQIFDALKPGGIYGIVDHHAEAGSGERDTEKLHRGDAEMIKKEILEAGFTLEAESDLLKNPDDPRTAMVFDPSIKGKSDRFIYKFRKPAAQ